MVKSISENIRSIMDRLNEVAGSYDLELEVENWDFPEDPDDPNWPEFINLGIDYKIIGKYRPATWGDRGGDPEEHPELDEYEVYNVDTGEKITDKLPESVHKQVQEAIWKSHEERVDDYDDYDDYRR